MQETEGRGWRTVQALSRKPTVSQGPASIPQHRGPCPLSQGFLAPGEEAPCWPVPVAEEPGPREEPGQSLLSVSHHGPMLTHSRGRGWPHSPHVSVLDGPVVGGPGVSVVQHG